MCHGVCTLLCTDDSVVVSLNVSGLCLQYLYDFMEAVITRQTAPEEAYRKLDEMASKQTEALRKLTKQVSSRPQVLTALGP